MGEDGFLDQEQVERIVQEMVDIGFDPSQHRVRINYDPDRYEGVYAALTRGGNIVLNMQGAMDKPLDETTVRESALHEMMHYLNYGDNPKMPKADKKKLIRAPKGGKWIDRKLRPRRQREEKISDNFGYWAGRRGMAAYGLRQNTMLKPRDHFRAGNPNISRFELEERVGDMQRWNRIIDRDYDELTPELMDQYEIFQRILEGGYK